MRKRALSSRLSRPTDLGAKLTLVVDRLERLTDLVLFLREGRPRSLREIADSVPGYPPEGEARRQAFERDKRTLRAGGVEITTVPVDGRDQIGYLIRTDDFYLPELELEPEEQTALNLAVAGVHLDDPSGRDALWRLGLPTSAGAQPVAQLPSLPALPALHSALRSHATVTFMYRGEQRHVDPALLRFRGGWWYMVGFDRDKAAARTFRVDRVEGHPTLGAPGSIELPAGFDPTEELPNAPWRIGEAEPMAVEVLADAPIAQLVVAEVGEATVAERREGGAVVVRLDVTNLAALRNWVLELGEHAEVISPAEVREDLVDWLEAVASTPPVVSGHRSPGSRGPSDAATPGRHGGSRRGVSDGTETASGMRGTAGERPTGGRADAGHRLHRLLAVLTWLARRGRSPVAELAERFGLSPEELVADLELAACCGLPPYTPDRLMEIIVDEKEVIADLGPDLARPRRLTAAEGFALAASARAIMSVPGSDPEGVLARAVGKLEETLGDLGSLRVDLDEPEHLAAVRVAALDHEQLELRYYSASSDEETVRVVDPVEVAAIEGRWYLDGYCHRSEGMRRFRVDRISGLRLTGSKVVPATTPASTSPATTASAFVPGPDVIVARIAVDEEGEWVTEAVPILFRAPLGENRTEITLGVASTAWFGRLLLRLGKHAEVLGPPSLEAVGREAASRLLERYRPR